MAERYLVTYAQDSTAPHRGFLRAAKRYCAVTGARLIVRAGRYHNQRADAEWHPDLEPYLTHDDLVLAPSLLVPNFSITPTAKRPLNGWEADAGKFSLVVPHPRVQFKTVPRTAGKMPRIFTSTGAVTVPNYRDNRAGDSARLHHVIGATVVEVEDNGRFHLRQIHANKDGSFYDLSLRFTSDGVYPAGPPDVVLGDLHCEKLDWDEWAALYIWLKDINAQRVVAQDVLDFNPWGHHERHKWWRQKSDVEGDLDLVHRYLSSMAPACKSLHIIDSNHHDHLDRWLQETHPGDSPQNAAIHTHLWHLYHQGDHRPAMQRWLSHKGLPGNVSFHDTMQLNGWDIAHGHRGPNGAKGSPNSSAKLGNRIIEGHLHSPSILDGATRVGLAPRPDAFGYARGAPSGWLQTHALIYPNGKRTLISFIDGVWRLEDGVF